MNLYRRQFRRLAVLDEAIRSGKYPNCRSFAETWEVHRRTIARDIELLREIVTSMRAAADEGRIGGSVYAGLWRDVGTPARLAELND